MEKPLLDKQDQYKFPMGQLIYEQMPHAEVTFRLHNRRRDMRLADYIKLEELQEYYDDLREAHFTADEITILEKQTDKNYSQAYLGYLATVQLPEIQVGMDQKNNDLTAETTAPWNESSLWEIPTLSALPELYYPRYIKAHGGDMRKVWSEGDRRLGAMIEAFRSHPDLRFAEFGTRRRFSSDWQDHVVERLATELPEQLIGTSNPWLADTYNIPAVGTNAHELGMVYAARHEAAGGNPLDGQIQLIDDWLDRFPSMPVVLTDTFTTEATLAGMSNEQIEKVKSYRIDSGDEYVVGHKIIDFLQQHGVDPLKRSLFFSNSLTAQKAIQLHEHFKDKIGVVFGIGGNVVGNLGFDEQHDVPRMNVVAKAVAVDGRGTVKLSDDAGKHMGAPEDVARYQRLAAARAEVEIAYAA